MSGLVEKTKLVLRRRSMSRGSLKVGDKSAADGITTSSLEVSDTSGRTNEQSDTAKPNHDASATERGGEQDLNNQHNPGPYTHRRQQYGAPESQPRYRHAYSKSADDRQAQPQAVLSQRPMSLSSGRGPNTRFGQGLGSPSLPSEVVPQRSSSLLHRPDLSDTRNALRALVPPIPEARQAGSASDEKAVSPASSLASVPSFSDRIGYIPGHKTRRSMDLAPDDPSPLVPRFSPQLGQPSPARYIRNRVLATSPRQGPAATTQFSSRSNGTQTSPIAVRHIVSVPEPNPRGSSQPRPRHQQPRQDQEKTTIFSRARQQQPTHPGPPPPAPLGPQFPSASSTPISPQRRSTADAAQDTDLGLPQGFELGKTEGTRVSTTWAPAVTCETQHMPRQQAVLPAVTRDGHMDHHHTFVQPIKVFEVLPAWHFRVDEATGERVEIACPDDFIVPEHWRPRTISEEKKGRLLADAEADVEAKVERGLGQEATTTTASTATTTDRVPPVSRPHGVDDESLTTDDLDRPPEHRVERELVAETPERHP